MMDFCLDTALFSAIFIVQVIHFCQLVVCFFVGCFLLLFPIVTMEMRMYFLKNRIEVIFKCIHPL